MQADELFRREAEDATRQNPNWSYAREVAGRIIYDYDDCDVHSQDDDHDDDGDND